MIVFGSPAPSYSSAGKTTDGRDERVDLGLKDGEPTDGESEVLQHSGVVVVDGGGLPRQAGRQAGSGLSYRGAQAPVHLEVTVKVRTARLLEMRGSPSHRRP